MNNENIFVNKIKFPTNKHLNVNFKKISPQNSLLYNGAKLFTDTHLPTEIELRGEVSGEFDKTLTDNWEVFREKAVIRENEVLTRSILIDDENLNVQKLEYRVEKNAKMRLQLFFDLDKKDLFSKIKVDLEEGAELTLVPVFLQGKNVIVDMSVNLNGDGSKLHLESAYFCTGFGVYDIHSEVNHYGKDTESVINMNGVIEDGSRKTYKYVLDFHRGVIGASGEENESVLALGDDFYNASIPVLLVGEDSIEASHGATMSELDPNVMGYIMSRGIDEKRAKVMGIKAKFADAMEALDERRKEMVESRIEEFLNLKMGVK